MSMNITPYPVLSEELLKKIGLQVVDYEFEYDSGNQTRKLATKPLLGQEHITTKLHLSDDTGFWEPEHHNLRFRRMIVVSNSHHLFGKDGIAPKNAEIGIAVKWMSRPSKQRGVFVGNSVSFDGGKKEFFIQGELPAGILRDHFVLSTILYLKTRGTLQDGENHLANEPGMELGSLDSITFYLTGEGSHFPIFTTSDDGPLWRVECDWNDPRSELFDENTFKIVLNEDHPDYNLVYSPDGRTITPLMREICLSAVQILIENVIEQVKVEELRSESDYDKGSLCDVVRYFIDTFDLDTRRKELLAYSLRNSMLQQGG